MKFKGVKLGGILLAAVMITSVLSSAAFAFDGVSGSRGENEAGKSYSGSGGRALGSGGSYTKYPVELKSAKNGTISAEPESARNGDRVKIFAVPDEGYEVGEITVEDQEGNLITARRSPDGGCTFIMSPSKVTVKVEFREPLPGEPDEAAKPKYPIGAALMKIRIGETNYQFDGEELVMDAAPFIDENGRTMLPVRVVAKALGVSDYDIAWDRETKTASLIRPDGKDVSMRAGDTIIRIGGETFEIDTAPIIVNGRIFLPMRALFGAFNVSDENIKWNKPEKTVTVTREALEDIEDLKA